MSRYLPMTKMCRHCKERKTINEFWARANSKDGKDYYCKECNYERNKEFRHKHPHIHRRSNQASYYRRMYGLELTDYVALAATQYGKCAICGAKPTGKLHVDHSHKNGKNRGLLCFTCNMGLGYFKENKKSLKRAVTYLELWELLA